MKVMPSSHTPAHVSGWWELVHAAVGGDEIGRLVNRLAWPVIAENFLQTLLGVVDMMMVSQLGAAAVAGVGAANQVIWVLTSAFGAVTVGTTVLVAHAIGAGDSAQANRVAKQSLFLSILIAVALAVVGAFFSDQIMWLMGAEHDLAAAGGIYLHIVLVAGFFVIAMFVIGAALRGAGDTQTPMKVTAFINVINVIAAYGLIFGKFGLPPLGVAGSAWGATIARMVGTAILLVVLLRGRVPISLRGRGGWRPDFGLIRRLFRVGIPSMIEQLLLSGGMLLYGVLVIHMGTHVYAAQRITLQIISLSFMPGFGFSMAATTLVGQSLGARLPQRAEDGAWRATWLALIWMTAAALLATLFGRQVIGLFSRDADIIAMGVPALAVLALTQPFQAIGQVLAGALRGAGDTRYPMWVTTASIWLIRVPLAYLFGPVLGLSLAAVYVSNIIDSIMRAALTYWRFRKGRWKEIEV